MRILTQRWAQRRHFFQQNQDTFFNYLKKSTGDPSPFSLLIGSQYLIAKNDSPKTITVKFEYLSPVRVQIGNM